MNLFKLFESDKDIFGFEDTRAKKEVIPVKNDKPIKHFNVEWMMDVLSRKKLNNSISATDAFLDHVRWGNDVGAVRIRLTPNIAIYIERLVRDAQGEKHWIMKRVFKANLEEFAGREEFISKEIFDETQQIYDEDVDRTYENYRSLLALTNLMATQVRTNVPDKYSYQDTKKVNDDYYIVYLSIANTGIGKLVSSRRQGYYPEILVNINYKKEIGLIHIIVNPISYGIEGSGWQPDIPWLDAWYAPTQSKREIVDTVVSAIKYF